MLVTIKYCKTIDGNTRCTRAAVDIIVDIDTFIVPAISFSIENFNEAGIRII